MSGPNRFDERPRSRTRKAVDDGWAIGSDGDVADRDECELCLSERPTSVEYGLRVCRSCENELLP